MRIFIGLLTLLLAGTAAAAELQFNFASNAEGSAPEGFSAALFGKGQPPLWKIVQDDVPPTLAPMTDKAPMVTRQGVLTQASPEMADEYFPMFVYDREIFRNFDFTTRFKIVGGVAEQMAGLIFRYQNASNFYVVRASALGRNVRFYKVVNGIRSDPLGPEVPVTTGVWHRLGVHCEGNQITLFYDDKPVMPTLGDNTFAEGKIGFWTKSDSSSYFTGAQVTYTPLIPVAQSILSGILEKQPRILGLRIYAPAGTNATRIIASKESSEVGQAGTEAELNAVRDGTVSFGRDTEAVLVTLPLHDRNGEFIGAVRVRLTSFFGETQNTAVARAKMIVNLIQGQILSADDLRK